ncbi:DinB family protein [Mucilaginibacter litoreus]|uniref:DinB family protein n=1 Tax=Mucilaginibacter litoreus TaxID=1048221 RepID=A0ABW3AU39_9SPHI
MYTTLLHQYQLVLSSRGAMFDYCETISEAHLMQPLALYDNKNMGGLMIHVADTYLSWLVNFARQQQLPLFELNTYNNMQAIRMVFDQVNLIVNDFLQHFKDELDIPLTLPKRQGIELTLTPLQLFTHVTTHEFHHKGQLANMSRQLGYIPVDTDVIRT